MEMQAHRFNDVYPQSSLISCDSAIRIKNEQHNIIAKQIEEFLQKGHIIEELGNEFNSADFVPNAPTAQRARYSPNPFNIKRKILKSNIVVFEVSICKIYYGVFPSEKEAIIKRDSIRKGLNLLPAPY